MKDVLKTYKLVLTTQSPVFVGDGNKIGKKEYILNRNEKKVYVPKLSRMYEELKENGLEADFTSYMLGNKREDLESWLRSCRINRNIYEKWADYILDSGDVTLGTGREREILTFIKDAYGLPYIPGSTVKGMFRTVLLAYDIRKNSKKYDKVRKQVERMVSQPNKRTKYLVSEMNEVERMAFFLLKRPETKRDDAVNDILSGIRVSDSNPIPIKNLTLCQKKDVNVEGQERVLPIFRECLKPGVKIEFDFTIDTTLCGVDKETILEAIKDFQLLYHQIFLSKFKGVRETNDLHVWLGGGSGFFTKTIIYALLGEKDGVRATVEVFRNTLRSFCFQEHKHQRDLSYGISPHTDKLTKYGGIHYRMGTCKMELK